MAAQENKQTQNQEYKITVKVDDSELKNFRDNLKQIVSEADLIKISNQANILKTSLDAVGYSFDNLKNEQQKIIDKWVSLKTAVEDAETSIRSFDTNGLTGLINGFQQSNDAASSTIDYFSVIKDQTKEILSITGSLKSLFPELFAAISFGASSALPAIALVAVALLDIWALSQAIPEAINQMRNRQKQGLSNEEIKKAYDDLYKQISDKKNTERVLSVLRENKGKLPPNYISNLSDADLNTAVRIVNTELKIAEIKERRNELEKKRSGYTSKVSVDTKLQTDELGEQLQHIREIIRLNELQETISKSLLEDQLEATHNLLNENLSDKDKIRILETESVIKQKIQQIDQKALDDINKKIDRQKEIRDLISENVKKYTDFVKSLDDTLFKNKITLTDTDFGKRKLLADKEYEDKITEINETQKKWTFRLPFSFEEFIPPEIKSKTDQDKNDAKKIHDKEMDAIRKDAKKQFMDNIESGLGNIGTVFGNLNNIISLWPAAAEGFMGKLIGGFQHVIGIMQSVLGIFQAIHALMETVNLIKSIIPFLAGGTSDFSGGLAVVGEKGMELVNLPKGSKVYNNSDTMRMLNSIRAGRYINNNNVYIAANVDGVEFLRVNQPKYEKFLKFKKMA